MLIKEATIDRPRACSGQSLRQTERLVPSLRPPAKAAPLVQAHGKTAKHSNWLTYWKQRWVAAVTRRLSGTPYPCWGFMINASFYLLRAAAAVSTIARCSTPGMRLSFGISRICRPPGSVLRFPSKAYRYRLTLAGLLRVRNTNVIQQYVVPNFRVDD